MRILGVTFLATLSLAVSGAPTLQSYAGQYVCPQLMQVKPAIKQLDKVAVSVAIEGQKAKVTVKPLSFSFASEDMPNGLKEGDFEYRSGGPVQLLALSQMGPTKYLTFTYDGGNTAMVATTCQKK